MPMQVHGGFMMFHAKFRRFLQNLWLKGTSPMWNSASAGSLLTGPEGRRVGGCGLSLTG